MPSSSIEFPYHHRRDSDGWTRIPVVTAEIPSPLGLYPMRLLLDSGADVTMLPRFLAEYAGLKWTKLPMLRVKGIEGRTVEGRRGTVTLRILKRQIPPIPCLYVDDSDSPMLLGREGFFDLFNITFDNRHRKIELTPLT